MPFRAVSTWRRAIRSLKTSRNVLLPAADLDQINNARVTTADHARGFLENYNKLARRRCRRRRVNIFGRRLSRKVVAAVAVGVPENGALLGKFHESHQRWHEKPIDFLVGHQTQKVAASAKRKPNRPEKYDRMQEVDAIDAAIVVAGQKACRFALAPQTFTTMTTTTDGILLYRSNQAETAVAKVALLEAQ